MTGSRSIYHEYRRRGHTSGQGLPMSDESKRRMLAEAYGEHRRRRVRRRVLAEAYGEPNTFHTYDYRKFEQHRLCYPAPKERPMNPNDIIAIVTSTSAHLESFRRNEEETVEEFENRVQRAAAKASAIQASDVFILRATQSMSVPVTITELEG